MDWTTKFARFAKRLLKVEYFVWLTTVDPTGRPQPRPVWFVWQDDSVLIFSQPAAHKVKHIQQNPNVSLHFNTEDTLGDKRVVIFTGRAVIDAATPPANTVRAYMRKYKSGIQGLNMTPSQFAQEYSCAIRITPANLRGWE